jgi:hypothetical protein
LLTDQEEGAELTNADIAFLKSTPLAPSSSAGDIEQQWNAYTVGSDKITSQIGSERFAEVATQAASVGAGLIDNKTVPVVGNIARIARPVLRFANFLTTPQASTRPTTYVIGAVILAASLLALQCASTSASTALWLIVATVWVAVSIAGLVLKNWGRVVAGLVLLGATIGLGVAGRHLHNSTLLVIGAGTAFLAAVAGTFACHLVRKRRRPLPGTVELPDLAPSASSAPRSA